MLLFNQLHQLNYYQMSTDTEAPIYTKPALEFKSTSFSVPVLVIQTPELKQIKHQLEEKIAQAPAFFKNSPVLIDLQYVNDAELSFELPPLIEFLHAKKLCAVGISSGNDKQIIAALEYHIPVHSIHSPLSESSQENKNLSKPVAPEVTAEKTAKNAINTVENMLVSQPVRSGQRIYAKGDLTILSHVSAGAEVMAEGNIHIYGALRGRALAGVQGNSKSRIFCSALQAELISIAGHYKTSEDFDNLEQHQPTQVFLQDQALIINTL